MINPDRSYRSGFRDVILVAPPFATAMMPMLGPSILVAQCRSRNIRANVEYSGLRLAEQIGLSLYERIGLSSFSLMLGDLLFRHHAFPLLGNPLDEIERYFSKGHRLETSSSRLGGISLDEAVHALGAIGPFIQSECRRILATSPKVVGFSSVFQQNLSSIALAKELRRTRDDLVLVVGGANAAEPMGTEMLRVSGCFDYAFSGEADTEFPDFVVGIVEGRRLPPPKKVIRCKQQSRLDDIASPDFDDYFDQLAQVHLGEVIGPAPGATLPMETSRGCWWGAKHHCTFCGLNGEDMAFRSKSPNRIVREMECFISQRSVRSFQATDNIMSNQFASTVLPLLERLQPLDLFFEVKSNLKESDLDQFVRSGVSTIQPGIESFSTTVLKRIEKGVTGVRNVWLLRECSSRRISVTWNLLVDVPGEREDEITEQARLLPNLVHLPPPNGVSRIVIDRFSPYFDRPVDFDIDGIRPLPAYLALYPADAKVDMIAYHFEAKYEAAFRREADARSLIEKAVANWRSLWLDEATPPKLYGTMLDSGRWFVEDTRRPERPLRYALGSTETKLLKSFRYPRSIGPEDKGENLDRLLEMSLIVELDGLAVSLVTEPEIGFSLQVRRMEVAEKLAEDAPCQ